MTSQPASSADATTQAEHEIRRSPQGPVQGFGQLWRKTYSVALTGSTASPEEVIATWKEHFSEFWPDGNDFHARRGIRRGQVALVSLSIGPVAELSTGVIVTDSRDDSFSLLTPKGHFFTGEITFSARREDAHTVARAEVLMRAADPLYELGLMLGGHARENWFWRQTLTRLAQHFGVAEPDVKLQTACVDKGRQWSRARNIRDNAPLRGAVRVATAPFRVVARQARTLLPGSRR